MFDLLFTLTAVKTNFTKQRICSVVFSLVGVFLPSILLHPILFGKKKRHCSIFKPAPTQISGNSAVSYIKNRERHEHSHRLTGNRATEKKDSACRQ